MVITLSPRTTEARLVHPENAPSHMVVTLSGITTEARLLHPKNAPPGISVTAPKMTTDVKLYLEHGNMNPALDPISTDSRLLQL